MRSVWLPMLGLSRVTLRAKLRHMQMSVEKVLTLRGSEGAPGVMGRAGRQIGELVELPMIVG